MIRRITRLFMVRPIVLMLVLFGLVLSPARAQLKTEAGLIAALMRSLQTTDAKAYVQLFPPADSLIHWILLNDRAETEAHGKMRYLTNNPLARTVFDTTQTGIAARSFTEFIESGTQKGVHWDHLLFVRYQLQKSAAHTRSLEEEASPYRYFGWVFVKDILTRKMFGFALEDVLEVNGRWYGGRLGTLYPASTQEEYFAAAAKAEKRKRMKALGLVDTTQEAQAVYDEDDEEEIPPTMKEVLDRKFYRGKFDNEIPVQLYVRYIKGGCPQVICSWDALFKFGDEDDYVHMEVSRTADGKWIFAEDLGGMELILKGDTYTGNYASSSDKTEYTVHLVESPVSLKKLERLDRLLEFGTSK